MATDRIDDPADAGIKSESRVFLQESFQSVKRRLVQLRSQKSLWYTRVRLIVPPTSVR